MEDHSSDWLKACNNLKNSEGFWSSSGWTDQTEKQNKNLKTHVGQEVLGEWLKRMEIGADSVS